MSRFLILLLSLFLSSNVYGGVEFDNTDDHISVTDFLGSGNQISVSAWVYFDTDTTDDYVLNFGTVGQNGIALLRDDTDSVTSRTDVFTILVGAGTDYRLSTATNSATSGSWMHVAYTFDSDQSGGADELSVYINGVEDANSPETGGAGSMANPNTDLFVGSAVGGSSNNTMDGKITEVALWTSVLTETEIKLLSDSKVKGMPLQIQPSSLQMYLPLHEQSEGASSDGVTFRDNSSSGNNGSGDDGANNTGLTARAEEVLSYP